MSESPACAPTNSYEDQATACLKAGETYRVLLLAVARKLAGSDEGGMDLFQQTLLNCHEAIQRNGFRGDRYEFYLLKSLRYLAHKQQRDAKRWVPLPDWHLGADNDENETGGAATGHQAGEAVSEHPAEAHDALAQLADQLQEEIRARFSAPDRIALRLHVDGQSYRDIAALVGGGDHTWISRRVNRMKDTLRETFAQAWAALDE